MASDQASSGAASRVASRTDPGWKYCFPVQEGDTNTVVCSFCSKEMRGGITRAKQHLMAKKGNVAPCTKCPKEVREELWALLKEKEKGDNSGPPSDRVDVDDILYVESEDEVAVTPSSAARKKNAAKKGPLDLYCNAANAKRRKEKMRQKDIQEWCDKKAILRVHQKIARWWYQAGLSFNCIKLESFQEMLTEVGAYGPNIVAPTYHAIRVPLLNMEMEYTNELLKNHEEQWSKHGCSIMSDAWTDRKQRCIINFLVSSSAGTKFVKSIDGSNFVKTGEKLFELLDSLVEEIGEEKVVQIITDNGSNYVLAGKMLEEKRKHLYWTPCAAHCLDLMLEDIGKIPSIKKTIQRAISLVGFIYSHSSTLSLLRQFTNKRELVRHAVTRFATSFLSLERLYGEKSILRKMFTSDEWNNNKLSKESKGKEASKVVLMPSFWNHVVFTLKVMAPLVRVLRLVDGEKKPAMGYIYEAMDKAKETIMKSFNNIESKYKDIFAIIDERWNCQLHRPLHAAGHFLNPEFFYANTDLEFDLEVTNGLYDCISRLVTSRDVQHKILAELPIYKSASGLFGGDFAISQRKTIAPAQWWRMYGHSAPNLQKLAIKILSLTCSASGCERNWSVFEQVVAALAVDHTGSRVLSGSYDYTVRMYDFQGMNSRLQSFRQLEPSEGHQVRNLSWSPTADRFLCVTGSAQAKIYDRDGLTLGEFVKGDMYIRDLKNTKGHISGLTCGEWHPKTKETILTSSEDGSLRIWDVNDFKSQKQVIKPKLARPGRVPVTTCAWDHDGKCIAGGIGDGSIQVWNIKPGWGSRPDVHIEKGHSEDITCLKFSSDGKMLLSRSFDGSLKVWDLRKMKEALKVFEDLPNNYGQTNITFSPDEQLFLTGTSVERESSTGGLLCFFDRVNLELVSKVGISPTCSVVQCSWHPKLNQIFATVGDKSQGGTHILYDPTLSERGALVCVARAPRKKSIDDFEAKPVVHNPHALPLFRDQPSRKRQREKILKDPLKSHKPELPMTGPGFGGRVGATQGSLLTQYLLKQGGMIKETWMEEDPREAILKYADVAAKDPKFIAPAYAETQPEPVFAKSDSEDEEK